MNNLHIAAFEGDLDGARLLLSHGEDPNKQDHYGRTPLHDASVRNDTLMTQMLLSYGADPGIRDVNGQTPYDTATEPNRRIIRIWIRRIANMVERRTGMPSMLLDRYLG